MVYWFIAGKDSANRENNQILFKFFQGGAYFQGGFAQMRNEK